GRPPFHFSLGGPCFISNNAPTASSHALAASSPPSLHATMNASLRPGDSHATQYHIPFDPGCVSTVPFAQPRSATIQPIAYGVPPSLGGVCSTSNLSGLSRPG